MPSQANCALPPGFQLDQYRIERQLSLGGFSIVYLARDAHGMAVAIKEYLPNSLALRKEGETEPQVSEEHRLAFRYGMKCFFEEGRSLAKLMHPNVVRVLNFFRANGTVYMVMQFERGRTLHDYIRKHRGEVKEMLIRAVFARMLNGLREVHAHKLMHLDIKPSNIYLRNDGTPVLLDFGAARQTLMSDQPVLKPMYTPGYAAPEQYEKGAQLGPWTDIYSVGASLHACIVGSPPPRADERAQEDTLQPLARTQAGRYSRQLLELVDWCLHLDPQQRPPSVYALQKALIHQENAPERPEHWFSDLGSRLRSFIGRS
ncbi:MAG TPA: serine/threonine-protein kinase [Thauera aminoaromatica]|uniref:non-specific serine/threonine protein kinase n=1 Tax=Thauera aminoaromatica S2 TaxID=1234381 RepID=N6Z5Z7_THASP|nr:MULTISPECIES: serine/threonine-protein kinase [Thauera]MDA0235371.1 serine/threonine-protein kinase [Pseudomonadota bacterium]OPZ05442.1 MAG: Serine/threonine-protein kinase StkP [Alphaproteobacteria bacterium ADurb.BinA305]ENO87619.1 XRE family transcriptional regulator [Thauera aminoaromatica S2]KIN89413.1 kinase domain protein [Thauera sp. SWB20]MBL8462088.1 serine/threonine protein kinase [Thauera sp.]